MTTKRIERLGKLLEGPEGIAIAITGQWGVGKTYFWKEYLKEHKPEAGQKYAYVSLFGIDSLAELKAAIVEQVFDLEEKIKYKNTVFKYSKMTFSEFKNFSVKGISLGGNLAFSIMFRRLSNTLICLDDIERRSSKLDIKDVLGLVDFLNTQKQCKVVVIINDEKNEDKVFQEYKEKVFDENFIIKDIQETLQYILIDQSIIVAEVLKKFYGIFKIENIRFYKKALRIFQEIMNYLPSEKSDFSTRKIIQSVLIFLCITDMPEVGITWNDLNDKNDLSDESFLTRVDTKNPQIAKLQAFVDGYFSMSAWDDLLKKLFMQDHDNWATEDFETLAKEDLITEEEDQAKQELRTLIDDFYNMDLSYNFGNQLHSAAIRNIRFADMNNLEFYILLLKRLGLPHKADDLEQKILIWVKERIANHQSPVRNMSDIYPFGFSGTEYMYHKIKKLIDTVEWNNYNFTNAMNKIINGKSSTKEIENVIIKSTKEDWQKFIFEDSNEERFQLIKSIWIISLVPEKMVQVREWIIEILNEKGRENIPQGVATDHIINLLNQKKK